MTQSSPDRDRHRYAVCLDLVSSSESFINFFGERYGWVPRSDEVDERTKREHAWILPYLGHTSPTEFECLAGALGWGDASRLYPRHAFFYRRDPGYIDTLPADQRHIFRETGEASRQALAALKGKIARRAGGEAWPGVELPSIDAYRTYKVL